MDSARDELYAAWRAYSLKVLEALLAAFPGTPLSQLPERQPSGWHVTGESEYQLLPSPNVHASIQTVAECRALPEFQRCVDELQQHPVIGPRIASGVATRAIEFLNAERLAESLVYALTDDFANFDEVFNTRYAWLTRTEETVTTIVPLIRVAATRLPIPLEQGIDIDELTQEEVVACLSVGIVNTAALFGDLAIIRDLVGVRIRQTYPVSSGQLDPDRQLDEQQSITEVLEIVVQLLRTFKNGHISIPGSVTFVENQPHPGYQFGYSPVQRRGTDGSYELPANTDCLTTLWQALRDPRVSDQTFLSTALRRFGFVVDRARAEDRLLDVMIAAEALFTPGKQTEIAFKLALNAAAFLHTDQQPADVIFRRMKQAYSRRSDIAHGSRARIDEELVRDADEYVRQGLRLMIDRAINGTPLSNEEKWTDFVLEWISGR